MKDLIYKKESYEVVGACMEVHKRLGCGFLEPVYQEALSIELRRQSIPYIQEKELEIFYKDEKLSQKYFADFICFDKILLELKALENLTKNNEAQVINYLKITNFKLGLLVNFGGSSLEYKRLVRY